MNPISPEPSQVKKILSVRRWAFSSAGLVFVLSCALLLPMLRCEFRHDDFTWLAFGRSWNSGESLWHSPTGLTTLWNAVFLAVYRVAKLQPALYYGAIIIGHALATCGVLWAAYELTLDRSAALWTALFFGVLWQHHEVITWIAVGYRPLAMLCIMICIASYVRSRRVAQSQSAQSQSAALRWLGVSALAAFGALLSKEDALSLLFALPLVGLLVPRAQQGQSVVSQSVVSQKKWRIETIEYSIFGLVFLLYGVLQITTGNREGAVAVGAQRMYSFGFHMLPNLVFCVPQMVIPDLNFVTYQELLVRLGISDAAREALQSASRVAGALLSLIALLVVWKGTPRARFCVLWCYVMFVPFLPFSSELARAPRYLYTGTFGLVLLLGLAASHGLQKSRRQWQKTATWCAIAMFLFCNATFLWMVQKNRWRDSLVRRAIATHTLRVVPNPRTGSRVVVLGVPEQMKDLTDGIALHLRVPVGATISPATANDPNTYVVRIGNAPDYTAQLVRSPQTKL